MSERKEAPWARLPLELVEEYGFDIAGVYAILLDVCPKGSTTATVSQKWLAKKSHMSLRTLQNTLDKLENLELIKRTRNSRASTYEIKPVIRLKGEWKQDEPETIPPEETRPSEARTDRFKRKRRKQPVHDIIREQEMEEIHKYLELVD